MQSEMRANKRMITRFCRLGNRLRWVVGAPLAMIVVLLVLFPGRRLGIAFTIATGLGRDALQERLDELEAKAIRRASLSTDDRKFLVDFYSSLATGGKLILVVGQTGRMMDHYLAGSGSAYQLDPVIFTQNQKVQSQARALRERAARSECRAGKRFSSPTFYMPDRSNLDSVFGLYHGTLHVTQNVRADGSCGLHWRVEVLWVWPSYPSLVRKYGNPHAESFPLPSLRSLLLGRQHSLFVDNGLGEYLEQVGLAKSFLAFAEWSDE
jgi:hypothetical protein